MKISCPACAAKYSIADEKVQDRLAKIRCRKCGTTIVIDGKVSPPTVSAAGATSEPTQSAPTEVGLGTPGVGPSAGEYSVDMGDNDQRTMDVAQLSQAIAQGAINEDTYVWKDGMADWQRIGDLPELLSQIGGSAAGAMPSVPPTADPFTPRAATAQEHSSAADLFGGIESAGGEEDVTTSAPEPAPAAPVPTAPAATGARNESSVLFSLSALTAGKPAPAAAAPVAPTPTFSAPTPARPMASTATSREDSGLIDLKALSTAVNAPGGGDAFGSPAAVAPLGLAPPAIGVSPLGGPLGGVNAVPAADDLDISRGRGNKGPMIIGGAILVVGLAAVAVFAMQGGDDKSAATTPTAAETTLAAPAPTPEPSKAETAKEAEKTAEAAKDDKKPEAEEPTAAPPPTGTAAPAPAPAPVPKKTYSKPKASPSPAPSPAPAAAPAPAPAPAPKPAAAPAKPKKCNCKPTDLLCAMKCSTK